jgi:hypothetical protein
MVQRYGKGVQVLIGGHFTQHADFLLAGTTQLSVFMVMFERTMRTTTASLDFGDHTFTVHTRSGQEVTPPCLPTHVHAASISVRVRGIRNTPSGSI